jgi:hypothetical protein
VRVDELKASLHAAADEVTVPDVAAARRGVDRHVRRRQNRRLAVAGVAIVGALLIAALTAAHLGTAPVQQVDTVQGGVVRLIPGFVPDGFSGAAEYDGPFTEAPVAALHTSIYARPGAADIGHADSFAVTSFRANVEGSAPGTTTHPGSTSAPPAGSPTSAGPTVSPAVATSPDGLRSVSASLPDGDVIAASSRTLSDDELRQVATTATLETALGTDAAGVPPGYELVARDVADPHVLSPTGFMPVTGAGGYLLAYLRADTPTISNAVIAITVSPARPDDLAALHWAYPDADTATVRGHDAIVAKIEAESSTTQAQSVGSVGSDGSTGTTMLPRTGTTVTPSPLVAWMEDPETLVQVRVIGVDSATALQIAQSMRPLDPTAWQQFLSTTTTTTLSAGCRRVSANETICSSSGSAAPLTRVDGGATPGSAPPRAGGADSTATVTATARPIG